MSLRFKDKISRIPAPLVFREDFMTDADSVRGVTDGASVYPDPFDRTPGSSFTGSAVPPQPYPNVTVGTAEAVRAEGEAERRLEADGAEG